MPALGLAFHLASFFWLRASQPGTLPRKGGLGFRFYTFCFTAHALRLYGLKSSGVWAKKQCYTRLGGVFFIEASRVFVQGVYGLLLWIACSNRQLFLSNRSGPDTDLTLQTDSKTYSSRPLY